MRKLFVNQVCSIICGFTMHAKTVYLGFSQMTLISLILLVSSLALVTAILIIILMVKRNKTSDSKYLALPHL